jgi:imidazolonepropionase-like amidohydrolase
MKFESLVVFAALMMLMTAAMAEPGKPQDDFVLRDARVFDGHALHDGLDVFVEGGLIAAVGRHLVVPAGTPEIVTTGQTLLPALLDAHTHNFGSSRAEALRFGVGTQIDMFTAHVTLATARAQRESLAPVSEADMWSAGTLVTAAGGHGTQYGMPIPTLDAAADAAAFVAARLNEGSDFIKLVVESGHGWGRDSPTLDAARLAAATTAARAHGKLAVAHIGTRDEAELALNSGVDGLVHLFGDAIADAQLIGLARERGVFVIPTLAVLESVAGRPSGLVDDTRVLPWLDPMQQDNLRNTFPAMPARSEVITRALVSTARLHAAGVPILAGSDAPNPGTAHGASLHRELELLVEAGLSPADALAAATSLPARYFGITDRGRIAPGLRADLLLVDGDPLADITATRAIAAIWKNGHRVERARFEQPAAAAILAAAVLGRFDDGLDGWIPTTDQMQNGSSDVRLSTEAGMLVVAAQVNAGAPWPWAGAMRMLAEQPMEAVDISGFNALSLRLRAAGTVRVLFFSGASARSMPAIHALELGGEWTDVEIPFSAVAGFDASLARAIAVVAGPTPGVLRIELDAATLQ